jgi:hypothetical protein
MAKKVPETKPKKFKVTAGGKKVSETEKKPKPEK